MAKVLLVNPSYKETYANFKAKYAIPFYPVLSLAAIAPEVKRRGHEVEVLDLCYEDYDPGKFEDVLRRFKPDCVGFTGTTPLFTQMKRMARQVKVWSRAITVVGGGAHVSALPVESLVEEPAFDIACFGEGDFTLAEIVDGRSLDRIPGVAYRREAEIRRNPDRSMLEDLDQLPYPAWELFDLRQYERYFSHLMARKSPVAFFETTRGCVYKCDFCASKNTVGRRLRLKSAERVVEEMLFTERAGFRELFIVDDIFTTNVRRTKEVCEAIIRKGIKMLWTCQNGIRVDCGDQEMFNLMRRAGCYKVAFGFESGNDEVLEAFGKGGKATLEQGRKAVEMAKKAGLDVYGFFMVGLTGDTEQTMMDTINYARSLRTDIMKISISIPFPGTSLYDDLKRRGLLKSFEWDQYNVYSPAQMYEHPNLSWETILRYHKLAYRKIFLENPRFIFRRLWRGLRTGEFVYDAYYFFKFFLTPDRDERKGRGQPGAGGPVSTSASAGR